MTVHFCTVSLHCPIAKAYLASQLALVNRKMAQLFQVREPKPGYVYIIAEKTSAGDFTGYYKVGKTQNLEARISELQTGNPHKLEYVEKIQVGDMDAAEHSAHNAVRRRYKSNVSGGREWYYAPGRDQFEGFLFNIKLKMTKYVC